MTVSATKAIIFKTLFVLQIRTTGNQKAKWFLLHAFVCKNKELH